MKKSINFLILIFVFAYNQQNMYCQKQTIKYGFLKDIEFPVLLTEEWKDV